MTATDELEPGLGRAFAFEPSAGAMQAMDRRVATAIADAGRVKRGSGRRWFAFAIAGLALALVAATTSLMGLYDSMGGDAYRIAWDRGQAVGLSQIRDGYRVTVERAYADGASLMLAVSVVDTEGRGHSQVGAAGMEVALEGTPYEPLFGQGAPLDERASANVWWFAARDLVAPGVREITVTVPAVDVRDDATPPPSAAEATWNPWHQVQGPWAFTFDLRIAGGAVVELGVSASAAGIDLALEQVLISPTRVRAQLALTGASVAGKSSGAWAMVGRVLHDGRVLTDGGGPVAAGDLQLTTGTGVDDARGDWRVVVDELVGMSERIAGPWEFRFTVP